MKIDPHVHCRDGNERHKETIEHVMKLCDEQGVDIVFDMPNTDPPILTPRDVEMRFKLVPPSCRSRYRLYIGATSEERQLSDAIAMTRDSENVVGLKLYAGESTGALAISDETTQKHIYEYLAAASYKGVLAVHCEKKNLCKNAFDPNKPETHLIARPIEAESESISDQIRFARATDFKGVLHICHVSCPASITQIDNARRYINITCGVTPHHLMWSSKYYDRPDGLLYKTNPPLRSDSDMLALRAVLKSGLVDWIETDHAPHSLSDKLYPPYASGYPSLCLYRCLIEEILPSWGIDKNMIEKITYKNIARVFSLT